VRSVAFSPDGNTLVTAGDDRTARLWDLTDRTAPRPLGQPLTGHTGPVRSVAFSPDGNALVTAGSDGTARLWDLTDRTAPRPLGQPLTGHNGPVNAVTFSPDGNTLATAGIDGTARLWDLTDRTAPQPLGEPLTGHILPLASSGTLFPLFSTAPVNAVTFSPDGNTLATAGSDRTTRLWDLTDRTAPQPLGEPLTGHTGPVRSVAFSPDGNTLVTAGDDRTVRLWDLTDRTAPQPLGEPLTGHTGPVRSVAFSPDGNTLVTAGSDGTARLWDLSGLNDLLSHVVEWACSITGQGLNPDQWDRHISGLPYQETCPGSFGNPATSPSRGPAAPPAAEMVSLGPGWILSSFPVPSGSQPEVNHPTSPDDPYVVIDLKSGTTDSVLAFYEAVLPSQGYRVSRTERVSVRFSGHGVTGDVIETQPVSIVIVKQ